MKPDEAINVLQNLRFVSSMTAAHIKGKDGKHAEKEIDANQMGIDALRKQIPQKPLIELHSRKCPACLQTIGNGEGYTFDCCENCGQALNWEALL